MSKLAKLLHLSRSRLILLFVVLGMLPLCQLLIVLLPLRWLLKIFSLTPGDAVAEVEGLNQNVLDDVIWTIQTVQRHASLFPAKCLAEAITAKVLLRWKNIPATLFLGARRESDGKLSAHAWLLCGERIVTGHTEVRNFQQIVAFR